MGARAERRQARPYLSGCEKGFRFSASRKSPKFAVVGAMFGRFRRPQHDKLGAVRFDHFCQIIAFVWRHMPRTAIGTIVVTHARPFVGPFGTATITSVVVAIPSHNDLTEQ